MYIQSIFVYTMLRQCCTWFLLILLTAGNINGDNVARTTRVRRTFNEGDSFTVSILTVSHTVENCFVETPNDGRFTFSPGDQSMSTEKFTVEEPTPHFVECILTINNLDKNDEGDWDVSYVRAGGGEARVENYHITVVVTETEAPPTGIEVNAIILPEINHYTNIESTIDITLSKESFAEECYVRPPNGEMMKTEELSMDNVIVQNSSEFVSCRISITPETEDLLGEWRICGVSTVDGVTRCQSVNIKYNNNNGDARWNTRTHPMFRHPVHFGGVVNPAVVGTGDLITCHVITPNGEDLVIIPETKYPHVERSAVNSLDKCSVLFTDININMIGDWVLYGKFRSAVSGLNEVRLPLNFALYNENNPYEQAYNITTLDEEYVVNLGLQLNVDVKSTGKVDQCSFVTPSGQTFFLSDSTTDGVSFKNTDSAVACQISIGPITKDMFGEWQLIGKFSDGNLFTEKQLTFTIVQEDPENPIVEEDRQIENLTTMHLNTQMGEEHTITIATAVFTEPEGCHIRTPSGLQYSFDAGLNIPGVEIVVGNGIECGVNVHLTSLDMIGEWILIARSTKLGVPTERRQPFVISVEETNDQLLNITVRVGSDLHLKLSSETDMYSTCALYGPNGESYTDYEIDASNTKSCGYIIRNVIQAYNGIWTIQYGTNVIYRETVDVTVLGSSALTAENQRWTLGSSVNISLGPEDANYCKLEDSDGFIIYDGFGQCQLNIDRVEADHSGVWKLSASTPGTVVMQETSFFVEVRGADPAPIITTSVARSAPVVSLTCSLPTGNGDVKACKFRDPRGNIFVAQHGVGQEGYSTNYESTAESNNCVLRLLNPTVADLGMWRCAMDTEADTHFAFLTVTCPWLMQDAAVAASVQTEPVLAQDRASVSTLEGHPTLLSCSVDAAIRYCYFRYRNGSIFNVGPAIRSSGFSYSGAGFHAGECGIRFEHLSASESGQWSCHVGLMDLTAPEQSATIDVEVRELMSVSHHYDANNRLVVEATVHDNHALDYCRFVRITGQGFTQYNAPEGFSIQVANGHCIMHIAEPNILDVHPWTVVAKLTGVEAEISRDTIDTLVISGPGHEGEADPEHGPGMNRGFVGMIFLWILLVLLIVVLVSLAIALIPKKNREWTMARAHRFRASRLSNQQNIIVEEKKEKQPLPDPPKYQESV